MWTKEEIGMVIKNTRLTAGLTQSQVAKALGRPQQTIANWEVGRSQPDANTLFELFKLLGADLNTSFGFFPGRKNAPSYSGEALKLAQDYDSLDKWGKKQVRDVADNEIARCEADRQARDVELLRGDREQTEAAEIFPELKIPTPVSKGGLQNTDSCLMSFVGSMDPGQQQNYYNQMHKMLGQQKESSTAAAPLVADDKSPEYEPPDQSQ